MKKIIYKKHIYRILFACMAATLILMSACKKEEGAPVITSVRNYTVAPNDTLVDKLVPGQFAVIEGANLQEAIMITFNGVPAEFNTALLSNNTAVVRVPDVIPFPLVAEGDMNKIRYVTSSGETTFDLDIIPGQPSISGISNENPATGTPVAIYGTNLFQIESLSFGGNLITDYQLASDGTILMFIAPELTQSGPLVIRTVSGADSTIYNVNDMTTGVICNFDDINTFSWGTYTESNSDNFPGNQGSYAVLDHDVLPAGSGDWWSSGRSINTNAVQWVPVDDLGLSIDQFALKFEISVPDVWNGPSIFIIKDYNWDYRASYEPWKISATKTQAFKTNGWQTVTIPLTEFRKDRDTDGGQSAASLTELLGGAGNGQMIIYTGNESDAPSATGLKAAIDNIRIVKIK